MAKKKNEIEPTNGLEVESAVAKTDGSSSMLVVGIGASAGGIEALEVLLAHINKDANCAYVVVQHLAPNFRSLMVEILEKHTPLPVRAIEDELPIEPRQIYVAPPGKNISVFHGKFYMADQDRSHGFWFPIDLFLESLAEDFEDRSVAVILSGTGTDGTHGGRLVKEAGGLLVVQDPEQAKFDGMPRSIARTGLVDQVLNVEEIPDFIDRFVRVQEKRQEGPANEDQIRQTEGIDRILAILRRQFKIDFSDYKVATIMRRIEHRMGITLIPTYNEYAKALSQSNTEALTLYRELLIGVTRFFRDPEAFDALKVLIPSLFEEAEERPTRAIRVWVAGCSTGEEAYSVAMLLHDHSIRFKRKYFDIKVFATDADSEALSFAGAGLYPSGIAADVPEDFLNRYFVKEGDRYRIVSEIRQKVVFAPHDVINNAPFSRIDLVTCRNVIIYFKTEMQNRVLNKFAYALAPRGYLFLGTSENLGEASKYFTSKNPTHKIFRFRGPERPTLTPELAGRPSSSDRFSSVAPPIVQTAPVNKRASTAFTNLLVGAMGDYIPDSIIVDRNMRVLYCFGNTNTYMQMPTGQVDMSILNLVNPGIQAAVGAAIQQAISKKEKTIYEGITFVDGEDKITFNLVVHPNLNGSGVEWLMVLFDGQEKQAIGPDEDIETYELDRHTLQRIQDLEYQLEFSEESLQATIEELETSNEELQATNEELMAANEELQSTNEELHSTNEELVTVNAEYHAKIKEMSLLNDDIDNILRCSDISFIFLDEDLNIRRFSSGNTLFVRYSEIDIGRPFGHFSHQIGDLNLLKLARQVLEETEPVDREVRMENGSWLLVRVYPYMTRLDQSKGVLLSFVDISTIKSSSEELENAIQREQKISTALRNSEERLVHLMELDTKSVVYCRSLKGEKNITYVSSNVDRLFGYKTDLFTANPDFLLNNIHPEDQEKVLRYFRDISPGHGDDMLEFRFKCNNGDYKTVRDQTKVIIDDNRLEKEFIGSWTDISNEPEKDKIHSSTPEGV